LPTSPLIDVAIDHDNNFDVLRLFAATAVIFAHSWGLSGSGDGEPFIRFPQGVVGGGALGVWMFFCISGYLVAQSYLRRSLLGYLGARILRIMPGLTAALLFSLIVAAIFSNLSLLEFIQHPQTMTYFLRGILLDIQYELPTFEHNPYQGGINRPLWTLPVEIVMYCFIAALGMLSILRRQYLAIGVSVTCILLLVMYPNTATLFPTAESKYVIAPVICFLVGALLFISRDIGIINWAGLIFVTACLFVVGLMQPSLKVVLYVFISYATIWVALNRHFQIRLPRKLGDVSYGLYIYSYPIQQAVVHLLPGSSPWLVFLISFFATLLTAWASWHLIEKPALSFKGFFSPHPR
jgi:peptidoglycan/LPS O-acetylase OafA/YrhL